MNLKIKIDKRAIKTFHKMPRVNGSRTKKQALIDITKECGNNMFYSINYIYREKDVIDSLLFEFEIIQINYP